MKLVSELTSASNPLPADIKRCVQPTHMNFDHLCRRQTTCEDEASHLALQSYKYPCMSSLCLQKFCKVGIDQISSRRARMTTAKVLMAILHYRIMSAKISCKKQRKQRAITLFNTLYVTQTMNLIMTFSFQYP